MAAALEDYQEALRSGRAVDRDAFLTENGEVGDTLAECLDALELIQSVAGELAPKHCFEVDPSPLEAGHVLGDFRIVQEIGRGGMGVVYEAEQHGLAERRVALKVLSSACSLDARALERFRVEAQTAACLNHPNIVSVFTVGCEGGIPFYAMPLIHGRSLAEILRARQADEKTATRLADDLAVDSAGQSAWSLVMARLGVQAAEALEHAHSLGVVHRDIKPSNMIVSSDGRLWVTDFGLARVARNEVGLTRTGDLLGTLRYMSPEQVRGEPGAGEPRVDVYALGATLYEALTLRPAFDGCDRSTLPHRILNDEPPAPRSINPTIPKDLETIVLKAMDKLPAGRYATALDLADDLRRFLEDQPIRARRPSLVERSLRWSRRHRALLSTAVAGIVLSLVIGAVTLWRAKQDAEANLAKVRAAQHQERFSIEEIVRINDTITVSLIDEATAGGLWKDQRKRQAYEQLIRFYDQMAKSYAPDDRQKEIVAKAARRAGALRTALGDRRGLADYARAIEVYEAMSATIPAAIWYRTWLISTLREMADRLESLGDRQAASARRRRAYEVAESLLVNADAKLPCFRKDLIPEFRALVELLSNRADASPTARSLADRLSIWLKENS